MKGKETKSISEKEEIQVRLTELEAKNKELTELTKEQFVAIEELEERIEEQKSSLKVLQQQKEANDLVIAEKERGIQGMKSEIQTVNDLKTQIRKFQHELESSKQEQESPTEGNPIYAKRGLVRAEK